MKILFDASYIFNSTGGGGVYNYLVKLIPLLIDKVREENDEIAFLHLYFRAGGEKTHSALKGIEPYRFRFPVKLLNKLWLNMKTPDLSWYYKDVEVFHSPHFSLPIISNARKIMSVNDITYLKHPEYFTGSGKKGNDYGYKTLLPVNIKRADKIISISQFTKDDLVGYFDLPEEKVSVVHVGCDVPATIADDELQNQLDKFSLLKNEYIYFPVGTLEPRKNISLTVQAFLKAVKTKKINLVLSGVGDRSWLPDLSRNNRIKLIKWNDEIEKNALYQGALFVVYPSLYEGFGIPVVEAMGNGKAVLTSNTTSLKELAEDYAHTVNPGDLNEIVEGIQRLLDDVSYRNNLEEKSMIRCRDFTWEKMVEKTYAVYSEQNG